MRKQLDPLTYDEDYSLIEMVLAHHEEFNRRTMDGKVCEKCHLPIPVVRKGHSIDRSNRVDCDKARGRYSCMCSYHVTCWVKEVCES